MLETIRAFFAKVGESFMRSDLDALESDHVEAIARDIGLTTDDLYRLDRRGESPYLLLPERLAQEGIKPTVVQAEWPSVWKDLQRVCALCDHADVCQRDFDARPDSGEWHNYCPNDSTMKFLQS